MKITFDIDNQGNLSGLYTDEIDLFSVGLITDVRKASNVEFNETEQMWEVLSLGGEVLHQNTSRQSAINFEIKEFSPGGKYYDG